MNPGHYLIVPSTFDPNEEGEFLIRVFTECANNMEEHDEGVGYGGYGGGGAAYEEGEPDEGGASRPKVNYGWIY